jgi:adenine deaminase
MEAFVRGLPKAELHVHIEGTLEPELMVTLGNRNDVPVPTVEEIRAAYAFSNLQSFLDIYYKGAAVLLTEQDFYELAWAYLTRAASDGVRRAELFFDPQTHTDRGVPFDVVVNGLYRATQEAADIGVSAALILSILRHLTPEAAMETLEAGLRHRSKIIGLGLDSSEIGRPPSLFQDVFARARAEGLHVVAHAGEEGPPEYIEQALDLLHAERIDHGVRLEEDHALLERVVAEGIPLTMCPLSNVKLRVFEDLSMHNLKRLYDAGVAVTINSDDPAYFGGYVADNYLAVANALDLSKADLAAMARTSLNASFVAESERSVWLSKLDQATR